MVGSDHDTVWPGTGAVVSLHGHDPIIPTVEAIEDKQRCIDYWGQRTEKAEAEVLRLRRLLDQVRQIIGPA